MKKHKSSIKCFKIDQISQQPETDLVFTKRSECKVKDELFSDKENSILCKQLKELDLVVSSNKEFLNEKTSDQISFLKPRETVVEKKLANGSIWPNETSHLDKSRDLSSHSNGLDALAMTPYIVKENNKTHLSPRGNYPSEAEKSCDFYGQPLHFYRENTSPCLYGSSLSNVFTEKSSDYRHGLGSPTSLVSSNTASKLHLGRKDIVKLSELRNCINSSKVRGCI